MNAGLDVVLLLSVAATVSLIYLALLGWADDRSPLLSCLFAALALIGAWWTMGMALHFSPLAAADPHFSSTSQIVSGFFGPVLLLFTLTYVGRIDRWSWRYLLVCVPALAGTANYVLAALFVPLPVVRAALADYYAGVPISALPIARAAPWYLPLQYVHLAQFVAFTLASAVVLAVHGRREWRPDRRRDDMLLAAIHVATLFAILLTDVWGLVGGRQMGPRLSPLLSLPFIAVLYHFMRRREAALRRLAVERETLSRYLPTQAVDHLLAAERRTLSGPTDAAVLFSDLRGFTTISERIEPAAILRWLDRYVAAMNEAILAEHGMVERLMGDGLVAVFGAPTLLPAPCAAAVRAAERMQQALEQINSSAPIAPGVMARMGIGITFGPVVVGSVGGPRRRAYTVLGDPVNTAQRLESLTKQSAYSILLSRAVVARLSDPTRARARFTGSVTLAGKVEKVDVFGYPWVDAAGTPSPAWTSVSTTAALA